ncbi:MAG: DUF3006 domain-containing protein [Clostridia bacterium]|nr:DUF3006 domain-containing protein [Clostridia bacterium]
MKYSVDRIEEGFAVCEDENGKTVNIEIGKLPEGVKEGDLISADNGEAVILAEETEARRKKLAEKRRALFERKRRRVD